MYDVYGIVRIEKYSYNKGKYFVSISHVISLSLSNKGQGYRFSNFDCTFLKLLCLYLSPILGDTTHGIP